MESLNYESVIFLYYRPQGFYCPASDPNLRLNRHHFVLFGPQQDPKCKILTNICCLECEKNLNIASKLCAQIAILLKITQYLLLHWGLYYKTKRKWTDKLVSLHFCVLLSITFTGKDIHTSLLRNLYIMSP
jgi:hypothetical protein